MKAFFSQPVAGSSTGAGETQAGFVWLAGEGAPAAVDGNPDDFYLDVATGKTYRKDWIDLGNIDLSGLPVVWHGWYDYLSELHEYNPAGAVDGNEDTYAENPNYPPDNWLQFEVDFGADNEKVVKEVVYVATENNAGNTWGVLVLARNSTEDGWTTVYEASDFVQSAGSKQVKTESFNGNETAYRYWAVRWSKITTGNFSFQLYEIYFRDAQQYLWSLKGTLPVACGWGWKEDFDRDPNGTQLESSSIADQWTTAGTNYAAGNATIQSAKGGALKCVTAGADDDSVTVIGLGHWSPDADPVFRCRWKIDVAAASFVAVGLVEAAFADKATPDSDMICIGMDADNAHGFGAAALVLMTNDNAAGLAIDDTGQTVADDTWVDVMIDCTDIEQPRVWVMAGGEYVEVSKFDIAGTIQAGTTLAPYIMVQALTAAARTLTVDVLEGGQVRD